MPDRNLAAQRLLAVTEEELQRIVLDIHDGPVQNLFAALSQLTLLRAHEREAKQSSPDRAACMLVINRTISLLETSLKDIRDLLGVFRAPEFAQSGLAEIVEGFVVQHESLTASVVTLEIAQSIPENVSLPVKIALCRILQEALANVRRHSGASTATVELSSDGNRIVLEIADRGRGFEPPPLTGPQATESHEHIGLRGMRERAALVGGELFVESRVGEGTRVRVEVPIDE
jgi:signal transduction histidine kinase